MFFPVHHQNPQSLRSLNTPTLLLLCLLLSSVTNSYLFISSQLIFINLHYHDLPYFNCLSFIFLDPLSAWDLRNSNFSSGQVWIQNNCSCHFTLIVHVCGTIDHPPQGIDYYSCCSSSIQTYLNLGGAPYGLSLDSRFEDFQKLLETESWLDRNMRWINIFQMSATKLW